MRLLLFITFPQGFRISKNIGHPTSGNGGKNTIKRYLQSEQTDRHTDRQTNTHMDILTYRKHRPRGPMLWKLNCHIGETVRDFDLTPTLRARPKYQLSSGSLVVEDYTQQNRWDYTQKNHDCAALESFKSSLWVLIVKKVVLSNPRKKVSSFSGYQTI